LHSHFSCNECLKAVNICKKVYFTQRRFFAPCMSDKSEVTDSVVVFQLEAIKTSATALGKDCEISATSFY